ncbi:MAG: TIGR04282 family arsenosugar biosynthesis glycosyltransferase [Crocinitomicaceae bacterium]|nr:TIGR04282 family arsenosugar biosynthesis glycosyltransferase [Crocinitomicaceae bacterium]
MPKERLLIVFAKNVLLGKVKTRLAKSIGDVGAFDVYRTLFNITEKQSSRLENCDIHIYFSDTIIETKWPEAEKFLQKGNDLGERMKNAFDHGFQLGYKKIIGIGTDLPDLRTEVMNQAFEALDTSDTVFGPATDGGYYLLGMVNKNDNIFLNKPWSTSQVLKQTLEELENSGVTYRLLKEFNDIDTLEDLQKSSLAEQFKHLYELS